MPTATKKRGSRRTSERPRLSATEATTFEHVSEASYLQINLAVEARAAAGVHAGCSCSPYRDVFTFNRWLAQSMHVRKGEKALKISSFVASDPKSETKDGQPPSERRLFPKTLCLFCRCQVQTEAERDAAKEQPK